MFVEHFTMQAGQHSALPASDGARRLTSFDERLRTDDRLTTKYGGPNRSRVSVDQGPFGRPCQRRWGLECVKGILCFFRCASDSYSSPPDVPSDFSTTGKPIFVVHPTRSAVLEITWVFGPRIPSASATFMNEVRSRTTWKLSGAPSERWMSPHIAPPCPPRFSARQYSSCRCRTARSSQGTRISRLVAAIADANDRMGAMPWYR